MKKLSEDALYLWQDLLDFGVDDFEGERRTQRAKRLGWGRAWSDKRLAKAIDALRASRILTDSGLRVQEDSTHTRVSAEGFLVEMTVRVLGAPAGYRYASARSRLALDDICDDVARSLAEREQFGGT